MREYTYFQLLLPCQGLPRRENTYFTAPRRAQARAGWRLHSSACRSSPGAARGGPQGPSRGSARPRRLVALRKRAKAWAPAGPPKAFLGHSRTSPRSSGSCSSGAPKGPPGAQGLQTSPSPARLLSFSLFLHCARSSLPRLAQRCCTQRDRPDASSALRESNV